MNRRSALRAVAASVAAAAVPFSLAGCAAGPEPPGLYANFYTNSHHHIMVSFRAVGYYQHSVYRHADVIVDYKLDAKAEWDNVFHSRYDLPQGITSHELLDIGKSFPGAFRLKIILHQRIEIYNRKGVPLRPHTFEIKERIVMRVGRGGRGAVTSDEETEPE